MAQCATFLASLLTLFALACGDGGGEAEPTSTAAPATPEATVTAEPAAETLAFLRDGDVWLIDADGGNERRLTNVGNVASFSWVSHDDIDVVIGAPPAGHLLVDVAGNMRELSFPAGGSWSRDGVQYVVPVEQQIVVFDRDGAEVARPRIGPSLEAQPDKGDCGGTTFNSERDRLIFGQPAFSPDGQHVLLAVTCTSRMGATGNLYAYLYEASLDGATNRELSLQTNLRRVSPARFSPDGARFTQAGVDQFGVCHFEYSVLVADASGRPESRSLTIPEIDALHQQTPRPMGIIGGLVAYDWSSASDGIVASFDVSVCRQSGIEPFLAALSVLKLDGSPAEKLIDGTTSSPAWSPSGRYIAYVAGSAFAQLAEPPTIPAEPIRLFGLVTRQITDLTQGAQPAWQPQP